MNGLLRAVKRDAADGDERLGYAPLDFAKRCKSDRRVRLFFGRSLKHRPHSYVVNRRGIGFQSLFQVMRGVTDDATVAQQRAHSFGRQVVLPQMRAIGGDCDCDVNPVVDDDLNAVYQYLFGGETEGSHV